MAVGLLVLGPEKLPEVAKTLGKLMADFRRSSDALRREFYNSVYTPAEDLKKQVRLETEKINPIKEIQEIGRSLREDFAPNPLCPDTIRAQQEALKKAQTTEQVPAIPNKVNEGEEDAS